MANSLPTNLQFRLPWRDYQRGVLDELEQYLTDRCLHVIAPPGSGKTVLGLEIIRRLDRPTLILSPTLAIRDQWIDRLVHLFLPPLAEPPDWISTDLRRPAVITSSTYQSLHSAFRGEANGSSNGDEEDEEEDLPDKNADEKSSGGDELMAAPPTRNRCICPLFTKFWTASKIPDIS